MAKATLKATQKAKGHIRWLDFAYVLSMFCVVWFHIPSEFEESIRGIEWVVVNIPFFFFSGIAFGRNCQCHEEIWKHSYHDFIKDRIVKLVIPTICFYFFFYVLWLVMGKSLAGDPEEWYVPLFEFITGQYTTVLATFWFVVALLVQQIIVFTISFFVSGKLEGVLCTGMVSFIPYVVTIPFYELTPALLFLPYFLLGYMLDVKGNGVRWQNYYLIPLAIIVLHVTLPLCFEPNNYIDPQSIVLSAVLVLVIVLISYLMQSAVSVNKLLVCLRDGSIVLLATQNYIIGFCRAVLDKMTHTNQYLCSHFYCKPLVFLSVYAITIPLILLIRRYAPFLIGKNRQVVQQTE